LGDEEKNYTVRLTPAPHTHRKSERGRRDRKNLPYQAKGKKTRKGRGNGSKKETEAEITQRRSSEKKKQKRVKGTERALWRRRDSLKKQQSQEANHARPGGDGHKKRKMFAKKNVGKG